MANLSGQGSPSEGRVRRNFLTDCTDAYDNVSGRNNSLGLEWSLFPLNASPVKMKAKSPKRANILLSSNEISTPAIPKPRQRKLRLRHKLPSDERRRIMNLSMSDISSASEVITLSEDEDTPTPPLTQSPPKIVDLEDEVEVQADVEAVKDEEEEIKEIVVTKSNDVAVPLVDLSLEEGELVETESEDEIEIISMTYIGEQNGKKTPTSANSLKRTSTPLTNSGKRKNKKSAKRRKSVLTPSLLLLAPEKGVGGKKKVKNASSGANAVVLGMPKCLRKSVLTPLAGTPKESKGVRAKALKRLGKTPYGTPLGANRFLALSNTLTTTVGLTAGRTWTERKYQEAHEFHNKTNKKKPAALRQPPRFRGGGGRNQQRQPLKALPYIPLATVGSSNTNQQVQRPGLLPNPMFIGPGILGPMFVRPPVLENGHPNFNGDLRVTFQNHNIQRPQTSFVVRNPVANIPVPGPSVQPDRVPRNTEQDVSVFGMNMFVPPILEQKGKLRPIVIDGSNVAMGHGNNRVFSCRGIKICVEYFKRLGHETILAFVPRYRTKLSESVDTHILDELENEGIVRFTPSRDLDGGRRIASYDDRYVIQCAAAIGGVIVSNDNFRDLLKEEPAWRNIIETRLLQFTWVTADLLIFPQDPLGRNGPPLHAFLRF